MGNTPPSPPSSPPSSLSSPSAKSAEILETRTGTAVLLGIPTNIHKCDVETCIQKYVEDLVPRGNLDSYNPKIFISYATGNRSEKDDKGCGPGMYYTKALVDCFHNLGYDTFTGLHIGPFVNWKKHYIGKLQNNVADVLIVVLAPAFFRSLPCLEEVYTAKIRGVNILPVSFEHPWVGTDEPWEEATTEEQLNMKEIAVPAIMEINSHPKPPSTIFENPAEDLMMIFKKVNEIIQRTPYFHRKMSPLPAILSSSDESESDDTQSSFKAPFKVIAINLCRAPERVKTNRTWMDHLNGEKEELRLNLQEIHNLASSSKVKIEPFFDSSSGCQRAVVKLDYRVRIKGRLCEDDYDDINYYLGNIRGILSNGLQKLGIEEEETTCILNKIRVYGTWESSINVCFKGPDQAMSILFNLIDESDVGLNVGTTRDGQPVHAVSLDPLFEVLPQNRQTASVLFDFFTSSVQDKQDRDCIDLLVFDENESGIGIFLPTSSEAASKFFDQGSIRMSTDLAPIRLFRGDDIWLSKVNEDGLNIIDAPAHIRDDEAVVLAAVGSNGLALEHASPSLQNDKEVAISAVEQNSLALQYTSPTIQHDKQVVMAAVGNNGLALEHASPSLQNDKEVATSAVGQNGLAFQYTSPAIRNDKQVVMEAVGNNGLALNYASPDLQNDTEVAISAVRQNGLALQYASPSIQNDTKVVMAAVQQFGLALTYAAPALQADKGVALTAVNNLPDALKYVAQDLKRDPYVLIACGMLDKNHPETIARRQHGNPKKIVMSTRFSLDKFFSEATHSIKNFVRRETSLFMLQTPLTEIRVIQIGRISIPSLSWHQGYLSIQQCTYKRWTSDQ